MTDTHTLLAIAVMAVMTFACRAGGYVVFRQITPTPFLRSVLSFIPGTLFVSYVVPALVKGGGAHWAGAVVTVVAMVATRSIALALIAGIAMAWGVTLL